MVLFRDDELRLIAAEKAARPRWKKRLYLSIKIGFWFAVVFAMSLVALSTQSGNSDSLKNGIAQYLSQATGFRADILHLKYMSFFPVVGIDFDELAFIRPAPPPDAKADKKHRPVVNGDRVARVGHVTAAVGFWDLFFARHNVRVLNIANVDVAPGIIDRRKVSLDYLRLDLKGWQGKPAMVVKGRYGDEDLSGLLEMRQSGRAFEVPEKAHFELKAGTMAVRGTVGEQYGKGLLLTFVEAGAPDPVHGTLVMGRMRGHLTLEAELHAGASVLKADLDRADGGPFTGTIESTGLDLADIRPLALFAAKVGSRWPMASALQADLVIDKLTEGVGALGRVTARVELKDAVLKATEFKGRFDAAGDGKTVALKADGLDLTLPYGDPGCVAARLGMDGDDVRIVSAALSAGQDSYDGHGAIGKIMTLAFRPAVKANLDCTLP